MRRSMGPCSNGGWTSERASAVDGGRCEAESHAPWSRRAVRIARSGRVSSRLQTCGIHCSLRLTAARISPKWGMGYEWVTGDWGIGVCSGRRPSGRSSVPLSRRASRAHDQERDHRARRAARRRRAARGRLIEAERNRQFRREAAQPRGPDERERGVRKRRWLG